MAAQEGTSASADQQGNAGADGQADGGSREWAWTSTGWRWIATTSIGTDGTSKGWSASRQWFRFVDTTEYYSMNGEYQSGYSSYGNSWGNYNSNSYRDRDNGFGGRSKDGDVPEWDGKSMHRTTYFRKIDLWVATTGVDEDKQGLRLLQKLTGEAFEKMENMDVGEPKCWNGVEKFKQAIVNAWEPIEDYRVGKIMDDFIDEFGRKRDQEIMDYNIAWHRAITKAEKVAGYFTDK